MGKNITLRFQASIGGTGMSPSWKRETIVLLFLNLQNMYSNLSVFSLTASGVSVMVRKVFLTPSLCRKSAMLSSSTFMFLFYIYIPNSLDVRAGYVPPRPPQTTLIKNSFPQIICDILNFYMYVGLFLDFLFHWSVYSWTNITQF